MEKDRTSSADSKDFNQQRIHPDANVTLGIWVKLSKRGCLGLTYPGVASGRTNSCVCCCLVMVGRMEDRGAQSAKPVSSR